MTPDVVNSVDDQSSLRSRVDGRNKAGYGRTMATRKDLNQHSIERSNPFTNEIDFFAVSLIPGLRHRNDLEHRDSSIFLQTLVDLCKVCFEKLFSYCFNHLD